MSPTVGATILFACMWIGIATCGYFLYRWTIRVDRDQRDGRKIPFERGL